MNGRLLGSFLGAWLLFPLALLVASAGSGLLVRALSGGELRPLLVVPVGFALLVVISSFMTSYEVTAPAAGALIVIATLAGLLLHARRVQGRASSLPGPGRWGWPLLAALAAFAAVGGPVFLTLAVGWTGFSRIVDIAFQMDFAQHLANAGRAMPANGNSSYNVVVTKLLAIGYPGGGQATLGVMANLVHVNVAWCYQAFLAFASAIGALSIYATLGHVTSNRVLRFVGATIAIEPNILYGYTLEAGIKELTTIVLLMVLVATLAERLERPGRPIEMVAPAVAASGAFGSFSLGVAPWMGILLVCAVSVSLLRRGQRLTRVLGWLVFAVVAIVISVPGLITAAKLATVAGPAVGGVVNLGLGNLAVPVSRWASVGVLLTGDYRYPSTHAAASHVFDIVIVVLACVGLLVALSRRRWLMPILALTAAIALFYYVEHSGAWIQLKAFTLTSVFSVLLAFAGVAALLGSRRAILKILGWTGAAVIAGAVLYGNALIYHDTTVAPGARYRDLAAIGARYDGDGPALDPTFDEYAEYFLRGENGSTLVDPANLSFEVLPGVPPPPGGVAFSWDLNQLKPRFLQHFRLIVEPRDPFASRPPSDYDLVDDTRYFEVWRRDRPASSVVVHYPLSDLPHERTSKFCEVLEREVRRAGSGAEVAYAKSSVAAQANPVEGTHPDYWKALSPNALGAYGRGTLRMQIKAPRSARYALWMQGSVGRPLTFYVDGRRIGSLGYEERYPGEFELVGHVSLSAGVHSIRVLRGNGSLHPGSGDPTTETATRTIGVVALAYENSESGRVFAAPGSQAGRVCSEPVGYEWMEVLRPGAAPPDALHPRPRS